MLIFNACLVDADVFQQCNLLAIRQPRRLHGRVRDEEERNCTNSNSDAAEDDKHGPPPGERGRRRTRDDVLEAIGHEAADDLAEAEPEVPEREPGRLLRLCVPLTADQQEGRPDGRLEDAEKDAADEQGLVVVRRRATRRHHSPERDVGSEPLGGGYLLEEVDWRGDEVLVSMESHLFATWRVMIGQLPLGTSKHSNATNIKVAMLEKSLPTRLRSFWMPITAAY